MASVQVVLVLEEVDGGGMGKEMAGEPHAGRVSHQEVSSAP